MTKGSAIKLVEQRSARLAVALAQRDVALLAGKEAGLSLRELAAASGLGVETVRRMLIEEGVTT